MEKPMKTVSMSPMKSVPLSELSQRSQTTESVLVTARGKILGVFHPLPDPDQTIPLEERRKLYRKTSARLARQLRARGMTEAQIERDIQALGKNRSRR
jgi:hypothetical protein